MAWDLQTVMTADGLRLHVRIGTPGGEPPRGTILFLHGGGDHGGRYLHVAERLAVRGWRSIIPDYRGHGASDGERWDVDRYETYFSDLCRVLEHVGQSKGDSVLLGHSFGGLLAARWSEIAPPPRATVLTSPLLGLALEVPVWKRCLGQMLLYLAPKTRFRSGLDPKNMMHDPERLAQRKLDPYLQKVLTARWFFAMQKCIADTQRDAAKVRGPLLVLQGADDRTVIPAASREWLARTSSTEREFHAFPGHVHELLNEADWAETVDLIAEWLEGRGLRGER